MRVLLGLCSSLTTRCALGGLFLLTAFANTAHADGGAFFVPEMDPASICGAITLLAGGALLLTSRRSAK